MEVFVSANQEGIFKLTLDNDWNVAIQHVFSPGVYSLGLDYFKDHFYCVGSSTKSLYKLDQNYKVVKKVTTTNKDAHGVDCFDDKVVVTNPSGIHMEIFDLDLNLLEHIPIPLYEKAIHKNIMRHHINSAQCSSAGEIYYTVTFMSNHDVKSHISRREDGHIMKIVDNNHIPVVSGLHLPHSLRIKDDYLYVCNKNKSCVEKYSLTGEFVNRTEPLDGWVRGLCTFDDNIWLVGLNCSRTDDIPISRKRVGIVVLSEQNNTWEVLNQFDLGYKEIFDIIRGPEV